MNNTIKTILAIEDHMSKKLDSIYSAVDNLTKTLGILDESLSVVETIPPAFSESTLSVDKTSVAVEDLSQEMNKACSFGERLRGIFSNIHIKFSNIADIGSLLYVGKSIYNAISNSINNTIKLSDSITQVNARLNLMNDGLQTSDELWSKIKDSADRSRASLLSTANAVASLGQRTSGVFANNDEVIQFSETLNKMFVIAGASSEEMYSATLQLTQALGSGLLRGEELNAVFEAASNIIQKIADYLGVGIGQIRNMASEGLITSQIVKDAMFSAIDEVNAQFESMPKTFSQVFTIFKNDLVDAFVPLSRALNDFANNKSFQSVLNIITSAIKTAIPVITSTLNFITRFFEVTWAVIKPFVQNILDFFNIWSNSLDNISPHLDAIATSLGLVTGALLAYKVILGIAKAIQWAFNKSLYACPLVLIALAVVAVIGAILGLTHIILKATEKTESFGDTCTTVVSAIVGAFAFLATVVYDAFAFVFSILEIMFMGFSITVVSCLHSIANIIDTIFHTNFSSTTTRWLDNLNTYAENIDGITSKLKNPIEEFKSSMNWTKELFVKTADSTGSTEFSFQNNGFYDATLPLVESIAGNTDNIVNTLNDLNDEVKYLSDIAERNYINNYNNVVKGDTTINITATKDNADEIMIRIKKELADEVNSNAVGVYS